jgi:Mn-dependent DtxR family transcriptional regulator
MNRKPFNPSSIGDEESQSHAGLSMADVLTLPEFEQKLVTWMVRKKEVSLAEVAAYMEQEEEIVSTMLNSLKEQGFVQELDVEGEQRYRPCLAAKQGRRVSKNLWQALD